MRTVRGLVRCRLSTYGLRQRLITRKTKWTIGSLRRTTTNHLPRLRLVRLFTSTRGATKPGTRTRAGPKVRSRVRRELNPRPGQPQDLDTLRPTTRRRLTARTITTRKETTLTSSEEVPKDLSPLQRTTTLRIQTVRRTELGRTSEEREPWRKIRDLRRQQTREEWLSLRQRGEVERTPEGVNITQDRSRVREAPRSPPQKRQGVAPVRAVTDPYHLHRNHNLRRRHMEVKRQDFVRSLAPLECCWLRRYAPQLRRYTTIWTTICRRRDLWASA